MPTTDPKFKRQKRGFPYLSPRDASNTVAAEDDFVNWYDDKNTRERAYQSKHITPESYDAGIQRALDTKIQTGYPGSGAEAKYESGYPDLGYPDEITLGTTKKDVIGHELTHAAGWDDALGLELENVLTGGVKGRSDRFNRYYNRPGEFYGNFHQIRLKMGIKPYQRSFTPENVLELIEFNGLENDPDVKTYLESFGPEKFSEALNTIASSERINLSDPRNALEFSRTEDLFA